MRKKQSEFIEFIMNKRFRFLFIYFLFFVLANNAFAEVNLTDLVKNIQPAVATILTYDSDNKPLNQGSGLFINHKGHLITNYHVLEDAYQAEIKTRDGKKYPIMSIIAENKAMDLIKVSTDIPLKSAQWINVAGALPAIAERIVVIGSPMGLEQTISEGIVSAVREIPNLGKIFQISAPISSGSSGSPVINMKGEVIGVATFQFIKGQNLNFAVSGKYVMDLKHKKTGMTIKEWAHGISKPKVKASEDLFSKGLEFYKNEEYRKAVLYFKKATKRYPKNKEAWIWLSFAYVNLGQYSDAIEAYKQAVRIDPDNADGHYDLGFAYAQLGQHREAIEAFKQAIRIKPDVAGGHYGLGVMYGNLGQ